MSQDGNRHLEGIISPNIRELSPLDNKGPCRIDVSYRYRIFFYLSWFQGHFRRITRYVSYHRLEDQAYCFVVHGDLKVVRQAIRQVSSRLCCIDVCHREDRC